MIYFYRYIKCLCVVKVLQICSLFILVYSQQAELKLLSKSYLDNTVILYGKNVYN